MRIVITDENGNIILAEEQNIILAEEQNIILAEEQNIIQAEEQNIRKRRDTYDYICHHCGWTGDKVIKIEY